jgi:hypothetical protein
MEQLKALIESSNGLGAFDALLKTLADSMNVSVQQLQQNLPEYLYQFGAYELIGNLVFILIVMLLLGSLIIFAITAFAFFLIEETLDIENGAKAKTFKNVIKIEVIFWLGFLAVFMGLEIIKFAISPYVYAMSELIKMFN